MMQMKIYGVEEIDRVMRGLPLQLNDKLLTNAHAKAAKPLVDRAHYLAPVYKTGNLAESIGVVRAKSQLVGPQNELGLINVGPRRKGGKKGHAGHLVEYGTSSRKTKRGANRGRVIGKPFMEPAWQQTQVEVLGGVTEYVGRELYNFIKRTVNKAG